MTRFVGCIDLHGGQVKQIVGKTLTSEQATKTNFVSDRPSSYYAKLYLDNNVRGTHVIKLGSGNDEAAMDALKTAPGFLQVGGGINLENCEYWLKYAAKVIVTSYLFDSEGRFQLDKLHEISDKCGKDRLVIDLSCRPLESVSSNKQWVVVMNKWQTITNLVLNLSTLEFLSNYADEFLIHAAEVEGLGHGVDKELVKKLGEWACSLETPVTMVYAGGAKSIDDLELVEQLSHGKVDLTFGSSLDLFGGKLVKFKDCCSWNSVH
ncbi:1-(5-phosphoribosyl)-5- ((5-phosphoribosylamino)methylideneamino)imidazole-4-carboxamide isomerase HIS6 Ecym_4383 [Eremothecium cymbalariae DBVPG|uniref:1-(5-phosphoribosyl)-5-[(5-phosphoribosylamino)methylideneamino] imidazole-4-carboxamide isomerase n=1 Tax=Eremothecium cymbalariae (strain CBS 270.75 / DBVPG 7215 / KCTC 17166 / NRRL Y-17582) TaxID=931890 RepID=G8JTT5_ERECY|nr:hypothetical protein Ecym_4383 [Eremothecium cymbalariae DBVPG\